MDQTANHILNRAIRVARLDLPVYREISRDPNATMEAGIVVAIVALASGIGALTDSFGAVVFAMASAFAWWIVFAAMTYFFGKNIFTIPNTQLSIESLMRSQGYARVPGILAFFGFIPFLGGLIAFFGWALALITAIVAIRETLIISTGRAIVVGIVALIASGIVIGILSLVFGVGWGVV